MTQNITANIKGLINSIALAIELAPSSTWGEPLHVSGLFNVLVNDLIDDKVNHDFSSLRDRSNDLPDSAAIGPDPRGIHPTFFPDRCRGCTGVRDSRGRNREVERRTRGGNLGSYHEPVVE